MTQIWHFGNEVNLLGPPKMQRHMVPRKSLRQALVKAPYNVHVPWIDLAVESPQSLS